MAREASFNDIPPELKPLTPFLQRAQELKYKDPTMSYWCSYFAVQQGVHLKPRDKASRNYLVKIMAPLEMVKEDPNSTVVTNNDAACLYIEDFALRVFDSADNEDRKGGASRGTAKKFLAAANFLELLKVFEENPFQSTPSDSPAPSTTVSQAFSRHKEKIRYAKWKAADIAKAFREGRKPAPGPANLPTPDMDPNSPYEVPYHLQQASGSSSGSKLPSNAPSRVVSNVNSTVVSPLPGASREASVSPRRVDAGLPVTSFSAMRNEGSDGQGKGKAISGVTSNGYPSALPPSNAVVGSNLNRLPTPPSFPASPNERSFAPPPTTPARPGHQLSLPPAVGPGLYATTNGKAPPASSPGGWSTLATPGPLDDLLKRNATNPTSPLPTGSFSHPNGASPTPSRIVDGQKSDPSDPNGTPYPPHPYPAVIPPPNFLRPRPQKLRSGDGEKTDDDDGRQPLTPQGWATDANRSSGRPVNGTPAVPSRSIGGPNQPSGHLGRNGYNSSGEGEWGEGDDRLGPLPSQDDKPSAKKVRWTPSVVGGLSSAASSSPPGSPRSELGDLTAVPESSDSNSSSGENKHNANGLRSGDHTPVQWPGSPPTSVEDFPASRNPPPKNPYAENSKAPSPDLPQKDARHLSSAGNTPAVSKTAPLPLDNTLPSQPSTNGLTPDLRASAPPASTWSRPAPLNNTSMPSSGTSTPQVSTPTTGSMPRPFIPPTSVRTPSPASAPKPTHRLLPTSLPFRQVSAAKKHSKFAASALEFDDLETARAELMMALAILNGERTE